jgi:hypothetical protein
VGGARTPVPRIVATANYPTPRRPEVASLAHLHRRIKPIAFASTLAAAIAGSGFAATDAGAIRWDPNRRGCWLPGTTLTHPSNDVLIEDRTDPDNPRVLYRHGAHLYQGYGGVYTCHNGRWYWGLGPYD